MNKSVRLTNGKRDSIIEQEVDKKFFDKENSLKDDLIASINKALVKTVPKWITPDIEASGYIKKASGYYRPKSSDWKDVASRILNDGKILRRVDTIPCSAYQHRLEYSKSVENKAIKYSNILKEKREFFGRLHKVLYSFPNSKQLLENVPELKDYFKDEVSSVALIPVEEIKAIRKDLSKHMSSSVKGKENKR